METWKIQLILNREQCLYLLREMNEGKYKNVCHLNKKPCELKHCKHAVLPENEETGEVG